MPIYSFECAKCKVTWDDYFQMSAKKESKCPECEKIGNRVFTAPQVGVDTKVNANDLDTLTKKTGTMKGTIGDLWDMAKEASDKRAKERDGKDPIKEKSLKEYAKRRKGKQYREPKRDKITGVELRKI